MIQIPIMNLKAVIYMPYAYRNEPGAQLPATTGQTIAFKYFDGRAGLDSAPTQWRITEAFNAPLPVVPFNKAILDAITDRIDAVYSSLVVSTLKDQIACILGAPHWQVLRPNEQGLIPAWPRMPWTSVSYIKQLKNPQTLASWQEFACFFHWVHEAPDGQLVLSARQILQSASADWIDYSPLPGLTAEPDGLQLTNPA